MLFMQLLQNIFVIDLHMSNSLEELNFIEYCCLQDVIVYQAQNR